MSITVSTKQTTSRGIPEAAASSGVICWAIVVSAAKKFASTVNTINMTMVTGISRFYHLLSRAIITKW